jgi:hypothetical protein
MALVHFTTTRVANTVDNGLKIICKEKEFYITQVAKLPMKANGTRTNSTAMEYYIIKM